MPVSAYQQWHAPVVGSQLECVLPVAVQYWVHSWAVSVMIALARERGCALACAAPKPSAAQTPAPNSTFRMRADLVILPPSWG
jgi:hypothetical protein